MLGKEEARNLIIAWDAAKLFLCLFVHCKAGSELLPVRSGAGKLKVLMVL
jgi:hypothetical protein